MTVSGRPGSPVCAAAALRYGRGGDTNAEFFLRRLTTAPSSSRGALPFHARPSTPGRRIDREQAATGSITSSFWGEVFVAVLKAL